MRFSDPVTDREPKTKSARVARPGAVSAVETIENMRQVGLSDANTRVCDLDIGFAVQMSNLHAHRTMFWRVLDGIVYDEQKQAAQSASIASNPQSGVWKLLRPLNMTRFRQSIAFSARFPRDIAEVHFREPQSLGAHICACEQQEIIDKIGKPLTFSNNFIQRFTVLLVGPRLTQSDLGTSANHRDRSAQVVTSVSGELFHLLECQLNALKHR